MKTCSRPVRNYCVGQITTLRSACGGLVLFLPICGHL